MTRTILGIVALILGILIVLLGTIIVVLGTVILGTLCVWNRDPAFTPSASLMRYLGHKFKDDEALTVMNILPWRTEETESGGDKEGGGSRRENLLQWMHMESGEAFLSFCGTKDSSFDSLAEAKFATSLVLDHISRHLDDGVERSVD